jgi:hypothetical protein
VSRVNPPAGETWLPSNGLWQCPACGKQFKQRGLWHSCTIVPLDEHFRDKPQARGLFDAFCAVLEEEGGPFRLSIAKTRIGFITRMTFAAVTVRKAELRGHFLLLRRVESARIRRVEHFAPYWLHQFTLRSAAELDEEMKTWLAESYSVGSRL